MNDMDNICNVLSILYIPSVSLIVLLATGLPRLTSAEAALQFERNGDHKV